MANDVCNDVHTCQVCYDDKADEQFFTFPNCGHRFCTECVRTEFEMSIAQSKTNLECLRCDVPVSPDDVSFILSEESYQKYLDFSLRRYLAREPDTRYCLAPDCPYACIFDKFRDATDSHFVCEREECRKEYCYGCKGAWHPGKSCQQARSEVAIDMTLPSDIETKECPVCHVTVEKMADGSCNQVKCLSCGEDFCWLCGKKITEMHFLSPTGCPLYGTRPWSRCKLWACRSGLWLLAPLVILLVALLLFPIITVLLPVGVGFLVYSCFSERTRRAVKVVATVVGVIVTSLLAPLTGLLGGLLFIPLALLYIYIIIPIHLLWTKCKS